MSLKSFHIIFIAICTIFMTYFAYWSYTSWSYTYDKSYLFYLGLSVLFFISLILYSQNFLKKTKSLS